MSEGLEQTFASSEGRYYGHMAWWVQERLWRHGFTRLGNSVSSYRYWMWRLSGGRHGA